MHESSLHRHGSLEHSHPSAGPHRHWLRGRRRSLALHDHGHHHAEHGHSHGLVHDSLKRSRDGLKAVSLALAIHALTSLAQLAVFVAGYEALARLIDPRDVEHLGALAAAGGVGLIGNWVAAIVRTRARRRLDSPALIADGDHARADAYVSLAVLPARPSSRWDSRSPTR